MDATDVMILRTMGVKPFVASPWRPRSLKPTDIASALGKSPQLVKDRIARMETDGVIAGYRVFPNLRHVGADLAQFHFRSEMLPQKEKLARLADVDGLVGVLWFYGGDICVDMSYASTAERERRLHVMAELVGAEREPFPLFERVFPEVRRPLTRLDWRIIRALRENARRPLPEVAHEVGVTTKTVRTRLNAMRAEGSIDEYVEVDYERMTGLIPFNIGAWLSPEATDAPKRLLDLFRDRCLLHFPPPREPGPPTFLAQLFAYTPAEIQSLLREALAVDGVVDAMPLMPTGGYYNDAFLAELVDRGAGVEPPPVPKSMPVTPKREIRS